MPREAISMEEFTNISSRPASTPSQKIESFGVIEGTEKKKDPFGEGQKEAATFAVRMKEANKNIQQLIDSGFNPINFKDAVLIDKSPFIPELAENYLKSGKRQVFENAAMDFAMAVLRKESGAAITPTEQEMMFELYIPQPGDRTEVLAQKSKARKIAVSGMISQAGKAFDQVEEGIAKSETAGQAPIEALEILKKRAQNDPDLAKKLRDRGLIK